MKIDSKNKNYRDDRIVLRLGTSCVVQRLCLWTS